jgi:hypothetical protein
MGYNKKQVVLLTWYDESSKKIKPDKDANRLSGRVIGSVMMRVWFMIKKKMGVLSPVSCTIKRKNKMKWGGGDKGLSVRL